MSDGSFVLLFNNRLSRGSDVASSCSQYDTISVAAVHGVHARIARRGCQGRKILVDEQRFPTAVFDPAPSRLARCFETRDDLADHDARLQVRLALLPGRHAHARARRTGARW